MLRIRNLKLGDQSKEKVSDPLLLHCYTRVII